MDRLARFPFFLILMGCAALSMLAPVAVALQAGDFHAARAFFYSSALLAILTLMLGTTLLGFRPENIGRSHLLTLVGAYAGLPAVFAFPFWQALPDTTYFNAFFEMVSSFTTTGASAFAPDRLSPTLHLWRAEVAWLGGLFIWITAAAILAPLNLGGFEIAAVTDPGRGIGGTSSLVPNLGTPARLIRVTSVLLPVYVGLTLVLWTCLIIAGSAPMPGMIYAMSAMSTSGITLGHAQEPLVGGFPIELLLLLFLSFALSRRAFSNERALRTTARLAHDPEIAMALLLILVATGALYLRHFVGAVEVGAEADAAEAVSAAWGTFFTVVSFLTTTGFVSVHWAAAESWSGLATPGFALLGLAVVGGGVATTAGGVKLLRCYALYIHGHRELSRLIHPSVVAGQGHGHRRVTLRGVHIAWLFFMLFALSVAVIWIWLSYLGVPFQDGVLLTLAALSTTGPLAPVVSEGSVTYAALSPAVKSVLMVAMVLGRLEMLVLIALFNTELWRG